VVRAAWIAVLLVALASIVVVPELRWRRWRWEVREHEVDIRRGTLTITRTLVPMLRVQHVDTRRDLLEQLLGLATVVFHTAAGENRIPALPLDEAGLVRERIAELARSAGLQVGEGDVLLTLRRAGEPYRLSPTALASSTLVATGTMTNRIDRLEGRGLVRRVPNPGDRRGLGVELTASGLALVEDMVGRHVANEQEMLAPLSARERDALVRATRKLLAHLDGRHR
jgi:DNA-binding MarR family transcriptional regulator